jgi:hypothetical protein
MPEPYMHHEPPPLFSGVTFDAKLDGARLSGQLKAVRDLMSDGGWRTLAQIAEAVSGSEAGVSARLRDLRKREHGSHTVNRRRVSGGLWEYQLILNTRGE